MADSDDFIQEFAPGEGGYGKYSDIGGIGFGTSGWFGGGGGGGGDGGGAANPFIPLFGGPGGQAPGWGGQAPSFDWGGMGVQRRRLPMGGGRMAFNAGGGAQGGASPMGAGLDARSLVGQARGMIRGGWQPGMPVPGQGQGPPSGLPQSEFERYAMLLNNAFTGGDPNFGGAFSLNPPSSIMAGVRQRAIQDAGAQERAARLGLMSQGANGGVDPSTLGFQNLMSQLQGQQGVNQSLGQADLALRQQQLENYWRMMSQLFGGQAGVDLAERGGRWQDAAAGSGLGQALGGLGSLGGALIEPGGIFNQGGRK